MSEIIVEKITISENKINYKYNAKGKAAHLFRNLSELVLEYPIPLNNVPYSILIIPFLGNILPLSWLTNTTITVEAIDKDFYNHIEEIKAGYKKMYPDFSFSGELIASNIEENKIETSDKCATFFSGGVDAFTTLIRHMPEKPDLITLWGADIEIDDISGWNNTYNHSVKTAEQFGLHAHYIKSNFRTFIDNDQLDRLVEDSGDRWWHGFQHGLGIISHAAPLAYLFGYKTIYIASSFHKGMEGTYTCASDPVIDNNIHFCGCGIIHDAYELSRQDKIKLLVRENKMKHFNMKLRVCYMESGGKNCCKCEKCYRTILEIISECGDPNLFGFQWNRRKILQCKIDMYTKIKAADFNVKMYYPPIQKALINNQDKISDFKRYRWLINMNFENFNNYILKKLRFQLSKFKHVFLK